MLSRDNIIAANIEGVSDKHCTTLLPFSSPEVEWTTDFQRALCCSVVHWPIKVLASHLWPTSRLDSRVRGPLGPELFFTGYLTGPCSDHGQLLHNTTLQTLTKQHPYIFMLCWQTLKPSNPPPRSEIFYQIAISRATQIVCHILHLLIHVIIWCHNKRVQ